MLIYKVLSDIKYCMDCGYEQDFSEQLTRAQSEILNKLTCIFKQDPDNAEIIRQLKADPLFLQNINIGTKIIELLCSSDYIYLFSVYNLLLLLKTLSILITLYFYVNKNMNIFTKHMNIIKNSLFICKINLPMFNDVICSAFNSIFINLVELESTINDSVSKILKEKFKYEEYRYRQQCYKDFRLYIEKPLKDLYDAVIVCLVEKQASIVKDVKLLINHINDYFDWFIDKIKNAASYLIDRYKRIAEAHKAADLQAQMDYIDLGTDTDMNDDNSNEPGCNVIASWLAEKWELFFYNNKKSSQTQPDVHPLKGNSFNDIIVQRAASRPQITT